MLASFDHASAAPRTWLVWTGTLLGMAVIGFIDYSSGTELRVFPLYYGPISLVAWHSGRWSAVAVAVLSALAWVVSNYQAGLSYSHPGIFLANTLVQGISFATVGLLIASLKSHFVRERMLSRTDSLTTLLNSRAFYEDGVPLLALCRRHGRPVSVAYLDLDNFKGVNDGLGHRAGDELLRRVADAVRGTVRITDLAARLGGDEFGILLPEASPADAKALVDRLLGSVAASCAALPVPVTVSAGVVTFRVAPATIEQMVRHADECMYRAKAMGKNQLCLEVVEGERDRTTASSGVT